MTALSNLKRQVMLQQRFNQRTLNLTNSVPQIENKSTEVWLKFSLLSTTKQQQIIDFAMLLLLSSQPNLAIAGKKIRGLQRIFGVANYLRAQRHALTQHAAQDFYPREELQSRDQLLEQDFRTQLTNLFLIELNNTPLNSIQLNNTPLDNQQLESDSPTDTTQIPNPCWSILPRAIIETATFSAFALKCPQSFALTLNEKGN